MNYAAVNERAYKKAVEALLENISFNDESKKLFRFDKLFYPVQIDIGQYAFDNYADQMTRAHMLEEETQFDSYPVELHDELNEKLRLARAAAAADDEPDARSAENAAAETVSHPAFYAALDDIFPIEGSSGNYKQGSPDFSHNNTIRLPLPLVLDGIDNRNRTFDGHTADEITYYAQMGYRISDETVTSSEIDYLENEPDYDRSSLIVGKTANTPSRILVIASAGHGKTTLLKRIALYYSHSHKKGSRETDSDAALRDTYSLSGDYTPCIIKLRDLPADNFSVTDAIENSLNYVFSHTSGNSEPDDDDKAEVRAFADKTGSRLLLLIDGLDELSASARKSFIDALETYVADNPKTHIIMSTRVAGLSEPGIKESLRKMNFRGRSIMPLTDSEAENYSICWIEKTQPEDTHAEFIDALDQILHQNRFRYLREFLRTPLELIILLKQISTKKLALNRFRLFNDMLWGLFTNHTEKNLRETVFKDTMNFLSFIAYKMQLNDSMFISFDDIEGMLDEINDITFYGVKEKTHEFFIGWLNDLAANIGIIEKSGTEKNTRYTFPIRAYQEYLAAYCCCHRKLIPDAGGPSPERILSRRINESRWLSIISYALSDMNNSGTKAEEYKNLVNLVFDTMELHGLQTIIESDIKVRSDNAVILFERLLTPYCLDGKLESIITACMCTQAASQYSLALDSLFSKHPEKQIYLEAAAMKDVLWCYNSDGSALNTAAEYIFSEKNAARGAQMLIYISKAAMGEALFSIKEKAVEDLVLSKELILRLNANALNCKACRADITSVKALASLWLTAAENSEAIKPYLDKNLAGAVFRALNDEKELIHKVYKSGRELEGCPEYPAVLELIYTLGSFPIVPENADMMLSTGKNDRYLSGLIEYLYNKSKTDTSLNQIALAAAGLFYDKSIDDFIVMWGNDICRGIDSEHISMEMYSARTVNHFKLVRNDLKHIEKAYRHIQNYPNGTSVYSLMNDGRIMDAARFCIKTMDKIRGSNRTNLAFLIRYGNLTQMELGSNYRISDLLADGIRNKEAFALMNMALFECECDNFERAEVLLSQIDEPGWRNISDGFWHYDMWKRNNISTAEGALVCVMAQQRSGCRFDDYADMLKAAVKAYADYPETVFRKA